MSLKTYERVFSSRFGGKYISILLSKSLQNKIEQSFPSDDEAKEKIDKIVKFLDDQGIVHRDVKDEGNTYYIDFDAEKPYDDGGFTLVNNIEEIGIDKVENYAKRLGLSDEDIKINKYWLRLKHQPSIQIINRYRDAYPEKLKSVLDDIKQDALIIINGVIENDFKDIFYPVKDLGFNFWSGDDGVSINFNVKSKGKGYTDKYIYKLSDILENEF